MDEIKTWIDWTNYHIKKEGRKGYFITVKDERTSNCLNSRESNLLNSNILFEKFYTRLCSTIVGNNYSRHSKRELLPLCPVWADYPGSKNGCPNTLEKPHFHAIALLHPLTVSRLEIAPDGGMPSVKRTLPDGIHLHAMSIDGNCKGYISYAQKLDNIIARMNSDYKDGIFNIYPKSSSEKR